MTQRLKTVIIGLGVMGKNHFRILRDLPEIEIVGLCDPSPQGIEDQAVFGSVEHLLTEKEFDLAIIAVPTPYHREIAATLMKRGATMLIEKPVASTVWQAREILETAQQGNIPVAVGHTERFNPVVQTLKQEVAGKEILSINIARIGPYPPRITNVGILTDLAVHDIDLLRFITGKEIVNGSIYKTRKIDGHLEDNATLSFQLEGKTVANIVTNWLTPFKKRRIEVATEDAYYEADLISQELTEYSRYTEHSPYQENSSYVTRHCIVPKGEPLRGELAALINYAHCGERGHLADIEDSLLTLEVIDRFGIDK
ncbi:MAG: gfo/Idh/MocA family oxidoreductase [Chitinivibrionales bacterium]|nr:gfo/Idh/MocA family oxidoreductase [Chitinivibrionales bacterium]